MRHSIFLAVATLFLAVCTPSIGYSNTGPQTDGSQPDTTKFTVGIYNCFDDERRLNVLSEIKKSINNANWNLRNIEGFQSQKRDAALFEILKESDIFIFATHGGYRYCKHWFLVGKRTKEELLALENTKKFTRDGDLFYNSERLYYDNGQEYISDEYMGAYLDNSKIKLKENAIIYIAACEAMKENLNVVNLFRRNGALAVVLYNKSVYDSMEDCKDFIGGLMAGKSINEAFVDISYRWTDWIVTPDKSTRHDYRIPRYYFGFMRGRETMTAMWKKNKEAYAAALMQMKADLESCRNLDENLKNLYQKDFKDGIKAVLLENGAPEDKVDNAVNQLWSTIGFAVKILESKK